MSTRDRFPRRLFLRGTGAAIALPALLSDDAVGAPRAAVPERLVTVFFGNGLPRELSADGFRGVLAPLARHAPKLAMIREVDAVAAGPFGNGHVKGSASFACGRDYARQRTKGGPSLDWVAYQTFAPRTPLATLSTGIYGADDADDRMRIVHSWRGIDQPNEPIGDTLELFDHVFGGGELAGRTRERRSVLDAVVREYRRATGQASRLGAGAKRVLAQHLEHVRELELRASSLARQPRCTAPAAPPAYDVLGDRVMLNWDRAWPVLVDLYVLALRCDLVRFGNLMVVSGGDRFPYAGPEGSVENVHADGYHRWPVQNAAITRAVITWTMEKIAHLLDRLDDPGYRDADGRTLLDNTTIVIGTELGDPAPHSRADMTYFVGRSRGRFRSGVVDAPGQTDVELYNTVLQGVGIERPFGEQRHFRSLVPIVS